MQPDDSVVLVRSDELAPTAQYAYAAVTPRGCRLVFTAGACPLNLAGETVAPGDLAAQAEQTIDNLEAALRAAGADLSNVVKTTVYVTTQRREDLVATWNIVRRRFGDHDPPSTLVGVAVLGYPGQRVEVEAVAAL